MMFKRYANQFLRAFLVVTLMGGVVIGIDINQARIKRCESSRLIYIKFVDRIIEVPNEFAVNWIGVNELLLNSKDKRIVVGRNMPDVAHTYFKNGASVQGDVCGLLMISGTYDEVRVKHIFGGGGEYVGFFNVPENVEDQIISSACRNKFD